MHELESSKKPNKIVSYILVGTVLALIAVLWFFQSKPVSDTDNLPDVELKTWVDRGISAEDFPHFQTQIDDIKAQIAEKEAAGEEDISLFLRLGNLNYTVGELALAVEQYDLILEKNPEDRAALENKGQALYEMGDIAGAEVVWRKVISLGAQEHIYFNFAKLIREHYPDRTDEIKPLIEGGIETLGQTPGLLVELGNWYWEREMYDEAISHYKVAYQLSDNDPAIQEVIDVLQKERAEKIEREERLENLP